MPKTLICTYGYRAFERDWAQGELVVVSDSDATRLLGFQVQVASSVHGIFREATAEESAAANAAALEWGVPVTRQQVPPRSELAQLPLEALRANGVSHGIAGAHDLTQDALLDAFDRLAGRLDAPSATTVAPLPLGTGGAPVSTPPVSPNGPDSEPAGAAAGTDGNQADNQADNQSGAASA